MVSPGNNFSTDFRRHVFSQLNLNLVICYTASTCALTNLLPILLPRQTVSDPLVPAIDDDSD